MVDGNHGYQKVVRTEWDGNCVAKVVVLSCSLPMGQVVVMEMLKMEWFGITQSGIILLRYMVLETEVIKKYMSMVNYLSSTEGWFHFLG